jgi:sec-independent protein translocase protein TatA
MNDPATGFGELKRSKEILMFGFGTTELLVIGGIILLIFGAKRLPDIGKGLGGAIREFKSVKRELSGKDVDDNQTLDQEKGREGGTDLEDKMANKVIEQVPGMKKAMDVKDKVDRVKKIIN